MQRRNFLQTLASLLGLTHAAPARNVGLQPGVFEKSIVPPHHTPHDSWHRLPLIPLPDETDAHILLPAWQRLIGQTLTRAIHTSTPITFTYQGGTTPGAIRTVLPILLFQKSPDQKLHCNTPTYLLAWCLTRQSPRTFRLDRIHHLSPHHHPTSKSTPISSTPLS